MAHYKGAASEAGRAMHLIKKREKAQMDIEIRKKKIEEELKISTIETKFAAHYDAVEQQFKVSMTTENCDRNFRMLFHNASFAGHYSWFGDSRRDESQTREYNERKRKENGSETIRKRERKIEAT